MFLLRSQQSSDCFFRRNLSPLATPIFHFRLFPSLIMKLPCFGTSFSQAYVLMQFFQVFHQSFSFLLFLCVSCPQLPKSILCSPLSLPSCFSFSLCRSLLSVGSSAWPANWDTSFVYCIFPPRIPTLFLFIVLKYLPRPPNFCYHLDFLTFIPPLPVLEIEPRALCIPGKHSATEQEPQPLVSPRT